MDNEETRHLKEEVARTNMRLDGVEGYFDSFDQTLNNHMTDYNRKMDDLRKFVTWTTAVQLALTGMAVASVVGTLLFMLKTIMGG